ncbi:MAG: ATP-binding cassette domain-containing protein [Anaerolineae bacterium]|nr:ATP-binding cassette domain-containing protein [Anaerolineae bacterium]
MAAVRREPGPGGAGHEVLLEVRNLKKYFPVRTGFFGRDGGYVKAVDDVSLSIGRGETLGLVGESGCGKTTLGRCVVRLYKPLAGEILFRRGGGAAEGQEVLDLAQLSASDLRPYRRDFQMIFQDPYSSLNPRQTVFDIISEPIRANRLASGKELEERVIHLMQVVGLEPRYLRRYPHAFSGGQRQRIGIARALATRPRLVVADEPVSALDVSIQAQILNLMKDLQQEFGLSYLFIAHDLSVVKYMSDRIAVMYVGRLVELARTEDLFADPRHPYTEALLSAVPISEPDAVGERIVLEGEIPNPANPPPGCPFHPRCRYAGDICRAKVPPLQEVSPGHFSACYLAGARRWRGIG